MDISDLTKPTPIIVNYLSKLKPGEALDIGAGYGRNSLYLAENGWIVDALDTDEDALGFIDEISQKKSLSVHTILQDFTRYDTLKEYDAILCLMTLHFMNQHEIKSAIEWIMAHTKPGGIVAISSFNDKNAIGTRPYLFSSKELMKPFMDWAVIHHEDDSLSSIVNQNTQGVETFHVSRILARKLY